MPEIYRFEIKADPQRFNNRVNLIGYLNLKSNKNTKILKIFARYVIETMKKNYW